VNAAEFLRKMKSRCVHSPRKPPFQPDAEAVALVKRSVEFAFDCGATAVSLIATRFGNGALEGWPCMASSVPNTPPLRNGRWLME